MIERLQSSSIESFLVREETHKNVLVVQGARQVGKTFLIEACLRNVAEGRTIAAFNLEKSPLLRSDINQSSDFNDFMLVLKKYGYTPTPNSILFIDEAQESPKLGSFVRFMKEEWQKVSVILSGSSISKLFDGATRVPVGRIEYLRITPLTFVEFLAAIKQEDLLREAIKMRDRVTDHVHTELLKSFDRYLQVGGLPAVVLKYLANEPFEDLDKTRSEIYLSQEEDFSRKESKLKPHLFRDGTKAIADLLGSPFSLTRISQNHRDAKATLETLCEWFIAYKCEQDTLSPTSDIRPKVYLYDVGLANQLRASSLPRISLTTTQDPVLRTVLGGLVENSIYLALQQGKGFLNQVSGWKKSSGGSVEVDFVVKVNNMAVPIEVKCSATFDQRHLSGVRLYLEKTKQHLGALITTAKYEEIISDDLRIVNLPVYLAESYQSVLFSS